MTPQDKLNASELLKHVKLINNDNAADATRAFLNDLVLKFNELQERVSKIEKNDLEKRVDALDNSKSGAVPALGVRIDALDNGKGGGAVPALGVRIDALDTGKGGGLVPALGARIDALDDGKGGGTVSGLGKDLGELVTNVGAFTSRVGRVEDRLDGKVRTVPVDIRDLSQESERRLYEVVADFVAVRGLAVLPDDLRAKPTDAPWPWRLRGNDSLEYSEGASDSDVRKRNWYATITSIVGRLKADNFESEIMNDTRLSPVSQRVTEHGFVAPTDKPHKTPGALDAHADNAGKTEIEIEEEIGGQKRRRTFYLPPENNAQTERVIQELQVLARRYDAVFIPPSEYKLALTASTTATALIGTTEMKKPSLLVARKFSDAIVRALFDYTANSELYQKSLVNFVQPGLA